MKSRKRKPIRNLGGGGDHDTQTIFAMLPADVLTKYARTRRLPEQQCVALFSDVLSQPAAHLLDVGCGTGRLAIPLAKNFQSLSVLGIDVSPNAVSFARRAKRGNVDDSRLQFRTAELLDFAAKGAADNCRFKYVLCHWCFHCVWPWRSMVLACVRCCDMSEKAGLFWLLEESELYRALDNLRASENMGEKWSAFWRRYHELRAQIEPHARPEHRTGTLLRCTDEMKSVLHPLGWNVDDESRHIQRWQESWHYDDIIEDCLAPRAFTNLQRLNHSSHARLVKKLQGELGKGELPEAREEITVSYSAKLVKASPGSPADSMEDARLSILTVCADIADEVIDLALLTHADHTVIRVLRAALANFFAILFQPTVAPRWKPFWKSSSDAVAQDNTPLWVWIRFLAGAKAHFRDFLRDCLWKASVQPDLFDAVIGTYFHSHATLANLAFSRTRNRGRPLVIRIQTDRNIENFDLGDAGQYVEILVPKTFVEGPHAYCADTKLESFKQDSWTQNSRDHLDALFRTDAGEQQVRIRNSLASFCQKLDSMLGVSTYGRDARRFVSVLQATRLFPGDVYCFFPVRDAHGNLVSSVSMGLRYMPTADQMTVLRDCIDRLLRVPSLILSPSLRGIAPDRR